MQVGLQVRVLDAERRVLAWNRLIGELRGDGRVWPTQALLAEAETSGQAVEVSVAWPALGVHQSLPLPQAIAVEAGQVIQVPFPSWVLAFESDPRPLPGVTVRSSVTVGVATAGRSA